MKRRFQFVVTLRDVKALKPHTSVTVLAKNENDAKKIGANMFPKLRVWGASLKQVTPDTDGVE